MEKFQSSLTTVNAPFKARTDLRDPNMESLKVVKDQEKQ